MTPMHIRNVNASTNKMKAMVIARLLMGDIPIWDNFENQRRIAAEVSNRGMARKAVARTRRSPKTLLNETRRFIAENFVNCDESQLARLCDAIEPGIGLSMRLGEFEEQFFHLADSVKRRFPYYAHVRISTYGLQFEFPEHHFLRDMETALPMLIDTWSSMQSFTEVLHDASQDHEKKSQLVAYERLLSRSIVSAAFSLVEAFLSGIFYTATHTRSVGSLICDEDFLHYAKKKESAPLSNRLDRVVNFVSKGMQNGGDEPFRSFIERGKFYRDAIHHSTPFERKDTEAGGRLIALYAVDGEIASMCVYHSCTIVTRICDWASGGYDSTDVAHRCQGLLQLLADSKNQK